ncbi:MAG: hypothetical protein D6705_00915 [Deltaproteobacteria bacterium]|nr:MAG: hypothetical protein D6705_00915 [Deltaproteobacteria bacterium]
MRAARWTWLAALAALACGPRMETVRVYPAGDPAARRVVRFERTLEVTPPDLFVLRPEEHAGVSVDPRRHLVYAAGRGARLLAIELDRGDVVWEIDLGPSEVGSVPVVSDDGRRLYVGTEDGELLCVDLEGRKIAWRYRTEGTIRMPAVLDGDLVYFTNSHQDVFALAAADGRWRWQYEREVVADVNTIEGRAGLALRRREDEDADNLLYTCFDDGKVVALGARTGEPLWIASVAPPEGGPFVDCDATPLLLEERGEVIVTGRATGVFALGADDGAVRWRFPVEGAGTVARGPGNLLVVTSSLAGIFGIEVGGRLRWRRSVDPGVVSPALVVDDDVFVTHSEIGLLSYDVETGETLAVVRTGSGMSSTPVVDRRTGRLFALSNRGRLYVFALASQPWAVGG